MKQEIKNFLIKNRKGIGRSKDHGYFISKIIGNGHETDHDTDYEKTYAAATTETELINRPIRNRETEKNLCRETELQKNGYQINYMSENYEKIVLSNNSTSITITHSQISERPVLRRETRSKSRQQQRKEPLLIERKKQH
jgi:S-adenosylmethionine synthetase